MITPDPVTGQNRFQAWLHRQGVATAATRRDDASSTAPTRSA